MERSYNYQVGYHIIYDVMIYDDDDDNDDDEDDDNDDDDDDDDDNDDDHDDDAIGDQRTNVKDFFVDQEVCHEDQIVIHGG